jgi:F420-dependent oxidoreductase-like protein
MDLRIFIEPQQGATYAQQLRVAQKSEELGFDAFFRSDHYLSMGVPGLPGPTDSWVTLGGLARETDSIRLGTLVSSATFRYPGPLAISVAQVDEMSGGRVELGLGAGWFTAEHAAYGIPFPGVSERFDRLEEQLAVITGLWSTPEGDTFTHRGEHYPIVDSPALPKPVQRPHPPVIIGGAGKRRTPALAARYAAEYNVAFQPVEEIGAAFDRARAACLEIGRDPGDLIYSVGQTVCVVPDEARYRAAAERIGRDPDDLRREALGGTPSDVVERIEAYAALGASRIYLQVLDLDDLEQLELIAAEVAPRLGGRG